MGRGEGGVLTGAPIGVGIHPAQLGASFSPIPRGLFQSVDAHAFAHPAEQDLARILSYYRIRWIYEPTTFHLDFRDDGRPAEQITPDFYLPDHDLFLELTTMKQRLVTRKNRKIRRLREAFPSVHIKLLYRRDYDRLVGAYPAPDGICAPVLEAPLFEEMAIHTRISELATEILDSSSSHGRRNQEALHLIGVGAGSQRFLTDLGQQFETRACSVRSDQLILSRYHAALDGDRAHIGGALASSVEGREVILVTDIVSSGLSLVYVSEWLRSKGASNVRICTLLDREDARVIDIPLDYVGFKAPDEVLVGYGFSSYPRFCDLPYIAPIHEGTDA